MSIKIENSELSGKIDDATMGLFSSFQEPISVERSAFPTVSQEGNSLVNTALESLNNDKASKSEDSEKGKSLKREAPISVDELSPQLKKKRRTEGGSSSSDKENEKEEGVDDSLEAVLSSIPLNINFSEDPEACKALVNLVRHRAFLINATQAYDNLGDRMVLIIKKALEKIKEAPSSSSDKELIVQHEEQLSKFCELCSDADFASDDARKKLKSIFSNDQKFLVFRAKKYIPSSRAKP